MSDATIRISGLSGSSEITVERSEEKTLADVLTEAGVDLSAGLDIKHNGVSVDPAQVSVAQVVNGDQVVTTPANVKLG